MDKRPALLETSLWEYEEDEFGYIGGPDLKGHKRRSYRSDARYHEDYTKHMWRWVKEGKVYDLQC